MELKVGEAHQIEAKINDYATNKELRFVSSDKSIITVTETGLVTAVKKGTASIEIYSADDFTEIEFTVTDASSQVSTELHFSFDGYDGTHYLTVKVGETAVLDDTYYFDFNGSCYACVEDLYCTFTIQYNNGTYTLDFNDDNWLCFAMFFYETQNSEPIELTLVD